MKKLLSSVCAGTLALSLAASGILPANAAPIFVPKAPTVESDVVQVDHRDRKGGKKYYKGHRGSKYYRPGYRRHGDFWFPLAAFAAGALIAGAVNQPRVVYRTSSSAHVEWCYSRYRSYRAWDNTFQPYHGPRRQCISPYMRY